MNIYLYKNVSPKKSTQKTCSCGLEMYIFWSGTEKSEVLLFYVVDQSRYLRFSFVIMSKVKAVRLIIRKLKMKLRDEVSQRVQVGFFEKIEKKTRNVEKIEQSEDFRITD